jgi:hypothetical protein
MLGVFLSSRVRAGGGRVHTSTPRSKAAKNRRFGIAAGVLLGFALLEVAPASATTLRALSIDQLAARSDVVVRARVRQQHCEWRRGAIVTLSEIEVLETLRGEAPASAVVLQLGGHVGDHAMPVAGAAELVVDEERVLFLRRVVGLPRTYEVAGMSQGSLLRLGADRLLWAPTAVLWDGEALRSPTPRLLSLVALRRHLREAP